MARGRQRTDTRLVWLVALAPLLAGPYFHSCVAPAHGTSPAVPLPSAEVAMAEAENTSLVVLGSWNQRALCAPSAQPLLSAFPVTIEAPEGGCLVADSQQWQTPSQCYCYDLLTFPGGPRDQLNTFVARGGESCAGGRSALIQLGPVFSTNGGRAVPGHVKRLPFNHPDMLTAFADHWDAWSEILAQPQFKAPSGTAEFLISIGNEVELYLDAPQDHADAPGGTGVLATNSVHANSTEAWKDYAAFFVKAAKYVRGGPMDLDGTTVRPHTGRRDFPRLVTFTSTWNDACSLGPRLLGGQLPPARCAGSLAPAWDMVRASDVWTFTRYKPFSGFPPEVTDVEERSHQDLMEDFAGMRALSEKAAGLSFTRSVRPIVIQEIGQPSSQYAPADDLLAANQAQYVRGAMRAFVDYNDQWPSVWGWWAAVLEGQVPRNDNPFGLPRVIGFNWFMLNDFDFPVCQSSATDSGFTQSCSWGLRQADGTPKPAWGAFVEAGVGVNPPALDLDRDCNYQ